LKNIKRTGKLKIRRELKRSGRHIEVKNDKKKQVKKRETS